MVEGIDISIEDMKQSVLDMKLKLTEFRKKGKYTKIAEMKMGLINSKIKMVEVTREIKDVMKVNKIIDDAKNEIKFIGNDGYKVQDEIDPFLEIIKMISQIDKSIKSGRKKDAVEIYNNAQNLYKSVQDEYKKEVFLRLNEIHKKLSAS